MNVNRYVIIDTAIIELIGVVIVSELSSLVNGSFKKVLCEFNFLNILGANPLTDSFCKRRDLDSVIIINVLFYIQSNVLTKIFTLF